MNPRDGMHFQRLITIFLTVSMSLYIISSVVFAILMQGSDNRLLYSLLIIMPAGFVLALLGNITLLLSWYFLTVLFAVTYISIFKLDKIKLTLKCISKYLLASFLGILFSVELYLIYLVLFSITIHLLWA